MMCSNWETQLQETPERSSIIMQRKTFIFLKTSLNQAVILCKHKTLCRRQTVHSQLLLNACIFKKWCVLNHFLSTKRNGFVPPLFCSIIFKSIWYTTLAEQLPGTPHKLPLWNLLWNGNHFQYVQANPGVMIQLLHKSTVYHIPGKDLWFARETKNRGLNRLTCSCHMRSSRARTHFCHNCC